MAGTKYIPLSKGAFAKVDEEDYNWLTKMGSWYLSDTGYAMHTKQVDGRVVHFRMHRLVNGTPAGRVTDHLNHDRLDNRRNNLRTVTQKENMANYKGAKGYCWHADRKQWLVVYKAKFYGRYKTEAEAIEATKRARSGVPKPERAHPRRRYLPKGVCYMQPMAQLGKPPYYIRPRIAGIRTFRGYFSTVQAAESARNNLLAQGGITS